MRRCRAAPGSACQHRWWPRGAARRARHAGGVMRCARGSAGLHGAVVLALRARFDAERGRCSTQIRRKRVTVSGLAGLRELPLIQRRRGPACIGIRRHEDRRVAHGRPATARCNCIRGAVRACDITASAAATRRRSQHVGNIFATKFLPYYNDVVASGAADGQVCADGVSARARFAPAAALAQVRTTSLETGAPLNVFNCHRGMVHDLALDPSAPLVLLSAGSEGCVRQIDLRETQTHASGPLGERGCGSVVVSWRSPRGAGSAICGVQLCPANLSEHAMRAARTEFVVTLIFGLSGCAPLT